MKKISRWCFIGLILLSGLLFFCINSFGDGYLHVFILNIGQGDAILIRTPDLEHILVDGGPNNKILEELSAVMPFYERTIEVVIVSHPHADHINGLIDVLKRYEVKQILLTGVPYSYAGYTTLLELAAEKKISVLFARGNNDFRLGKVALDIVYPFSSLQGKHFENLNNSSITFRLLYGTRGFYFPGDLELEGEKQLTESTLNLQADVLKVGHHGSRTSSSKALLERVQPEYALISCGIKNKFKHPHAETLQSLQEHGITVYRTDLDGRIEAVSDGKEILSVHGV